jgi:Fe-S cluster assembly protein SufD
VKPQKLSIEALRDAVARLPDDRLMPMRRAALEQLGDQGLPTPRDEDWKYTNIAPFVDIRAGAPAGGVLDAVVQQVKQSIDADWLVIANGIAELQPVAGVDIALLSKADVSLDSPFALTQLNTALLHDGIQIQIASDVAVDRPIGILFIDDAGTESGISQGRVEIELENGSRARFVEYHLSQGAERQHANSVVNLELGPGASVDYVRIQNRDHLHSQTGRLQVSLQSDSQFTHCGFDLGGALVRNDLGISIDGPGVSVSFDGLHLAGGEQHIDNHTRVDHRVGPAESRQEYRGILTGNARCVWNGKAIVHVGADGTDAAQASHNLLLSDKAEIDAKPELEIYTDDVKCSHGTTVGQLDEAALYYLRTRVLDKNLAQQVLTRAFAQAIVSRSPIASCHELLAEMIEKRLGEMLEDLDQ